MDLASEVRSRIESCTTTPQELAGTVLDLIVQARTQGFSTFSPSIYDTAWLSMIQKRVGDELTWLFPECFDFLLRTQQSDGTWTCYAVPIDAILNTLSALLALLKHCEILTQDQQAEILLGGRITKAQSGLQLLLQQWIVEETDHVGFEILVPALLGHIAEFGIQFDFHGKTQLEQRRNDKMSRFSPKVLYLQQQTTLLHSLEGLVGVLDFNLISHHCKEDLGMLGSPSSTAAYLVNCSEWDTKAEAYLRKVVDSYKDIGGVPSAFPTHVFETSWALSTLLLCAATVSDLDTHSVSSARRVFREINESHHGTTGFAPGALEDADDTARVLLTLRLLGDEVDLTPMITKFEADNSFKTYEIEGNPSFSANCNVLLALLESSSPDSHQDQITKILNFLLRGFNEGNLSDKWNLSLLYVSMLMMAGLSKLLELWDCNYLGEVPEEMFRDKVPLVVCQLLSNLVASQSDNGSWFGSAETTAYACIAIARSISLPWDSDVRQRLSQCLTHGRSYLKSAGRLHNKPEYLWIEKVTYNSCLLNKAFYVSAMHARCDPKDWTERVVSTFSTGHSAKKIAGFLKHLPLFAGTPISCLGLASLEAKFYLARLTACKDDVFVRDDIRLSKDKYLDYIPLIWTICNQITGHALTSNQLWTMIHLSLLNYQADEFMESYVSRLSVGDLQALKNSLAADLAASSLLRSEDLCLMSGMGIPHNSNGDHPEDVSDHQHSTRAHDRLIDLSKASRTLHTYATFISQHPAVVASPLPDRQEVSHAIFDFLLAHMKHNSDNERLQSIRTRPTMTAVDDANISLPQRSYFSWVTSDAATDTSCPSAFKFFTCLISPQPGRSLFFSPPAKYLSESLAHHLAVLCRQHNDYGSAARDAAENNLNSLDFAEFQIRPSVSSSGPKTSNADVTVNRFTTTTTTTTATTAIGEVEDGTVDELAKQAMKAELMAIADFERACMNLTYERLQHQPGVSHATMQKILVFIRVTDLFGQIYIQRDIASRAQSVTTVGKVNGVEKKAAAGVRREEYKGA